MSFVVSVAMATMHLAAIYGDHHSNSNDRAHDRGTITQETRQPAEDSLSPKRSPSSSNTLSTSPSPPPSTGWVGRGVSAGTSLELTLPREPMEGREGRGAVVSEGSGSGESISFHYTVTLLYLYQ